MRFFDAGIAFGMRVVEFRLTGGGAALTTGYVAEIPSG